MTNPTDTKSFFESRIFDLQGQIQSLETRVKTLSWIRVLLFVGVVVAIVYFTNVRAIQLALIAILAFVPLFGWLVKKHNQVNFSLRQHQFLSAINQDELLRTEGRLSGLDDGIDYLDHQHEYAPDLDLFGSNSLFQLLVRSRLRGTRDLMAKWLLNKSSKNNLEERHTAVKELEKNTEWRQNLTAYGYHGDQEDKKYANVVLSLIQWIDDNLNLLKNPFWLIARFLMPLVSVIFIFGIAFLEWPYQWIYLPILVNIGLLSVLFKSTMEVTNEFGNIASFLKGYENVILEIEKKSFQSELLISLHDQLKTENGSASGSIKSLRRILMFLLNRANILYLPFNVLFLLDVNWLILAVQWKKKNIDKVEKWFDAVHQIDALNDLASYAYTNQDFVFPTVTSESQHLLTRNLGHPLINPSQRVLNDFELSGQGQLGLITGSNMSGKSTFLRTIGVNLVLAQLGAPVCASKFEFSLAQIFTSMRTQDNLEENVSSFYAELKRLKQLLDLLNKNEPTFFMLDEILKGTNSEDRHKGAISLIYQLVNHECRGLVSTHDIQLSTLSKDLPKVQNMSFNSVINGDEIIFDYKLSLSPCTSFNASKLMEKMGIIKI
ncbi:MAG: hypothetical protein ABJF11_05570 [Reichenbachiella sp.]|uniref:MutS-related protein n=1 Tax=Reichenbachiella sp. TaxID=2184521 RepID=UPI0032663F8B